MDFDLDAGQQLLQDTLRRLLRDASGHPRWQPGAGFDAGLWRQLADMGVLGLPFAAADGGTDASPTELLVALQEFGRALMLEPYVDSVVLCGGLLRRLAQGELRSRTLPAIANGSLVLALVHDEVTAPCAMRATAQGGDWFLHGRRPLVAGAPAANRLLVTAAHQRRTALFMVDPGSEGASLRPFRLHDGSWAAEVVLDNVRVRGADCVSVDADAALDRVLDEAVAAVCAEIVGAMEEAYAMTVEYLGTRKQFGVAIGSFQALRHKAADMRVDLEHACSMAVLAMLAGGSDDEAERRRAVSAAKVHIARAGRRLGQSAIQLHGAIGMTDEYKVGHLFKRIESLARRFGDAETHTERLAACGGALAEAA